MNKQVSMNDIISQVEGNIVSDMDGEKVMLSIENGKYYNLGDVGGRIWECIKEPISIYNLIHSLLDQYNIEEEKCSDQVIRFIERLLEQGLVKADSA